MQPNQERRNRLSPLVIRSLGVLAISLMATTTPLASSTEVPTCERICEPMAHTDCRTDCHNWDGMACPPINTHGWCWVNCEYEWQCVGTDCLDFDMEDGLRMECVLIGDRPL